MQYLWAEPSGSALYPVLLYLDGSGCRSVTNVIAFAPHLQQIGFGILLPEKRGVRIDDDGTHCSETFLRTNDRLQRVQDAALVLADARRELPRWDGRLVIVGASEGGAIAAELALSEPSAVAVISLAGGGWNQADELKWTHTRRLPIGEREKALVSLESTFEEIRHAPVSDRTWLGPSNTFKRWASFLSYAPVDDLVKLHIPIFMAQGARDDAVPVESAEAVVARFRDLGKRNLTYRRYDSLDHHWTDARGKAHVREVLSDVMQWLQVTVPPPNSR